MCVPPLPQFHMTVLKQLIFRTLGLLRVLIVCLLLLLSFLGCACMQIFESFLALMIPEYDSSVLSACCQGLQSMIPFMCNFAVYEKLAPLLW